MPTDRNPVKNEVPEAECRIKSRLYCGSAQRLAVIFSLCLITSQYSLP
jgi:hypothetical protein